MSANGAGAHATLLGYGNLPLHGWCWHYVWKAFAANGARTDMGSYPNAYSAWAASSGKHAGDRNPPYGAAVWLGKRYDGNLHGDVFIAGAYDGNHAATDQPVYGVTGTCTIAERISVCGREYLGWTECVLDCPIDLGMRETEPEPEPKPLYPGGEYNMAYSIVPIKDDNGIYIVSLTNGKRKRISSPYHVSLLQRLRENNSDDQMLAAELDIAGGYVDAIKDD